MKTLIKHIEEKLVINKDFDIIDKYYFVYDVDKPTKIRIISNFWVQFNKCKNNVYIDGKNIKLDEYGYTHITFKPGIYYVEIKNIDGLKSYRNMFAGCEQLVSVPKFDTSKAILMTYMFLGCNKLKQVPLFDTSNVENLESMFNDCSNLIEVPLFNIQKLETVIMTEMFLGCNSLSEKTKNQWSKIYNFAKNNKKK